LLLGRFSEHFEFKAPEEDTVLKMVKEWIDGKRVDTPFHESFTPESAAKLLNGMSPADIRDRLQQAVDVGVCRIVSSGSELDRITIEDLKEVLA
jgi:SpoVK/Ycf46/Vps4 family AAA+-type ATPase